MGQSKRDILQLRAHPPSIKKLCGENWPKVGFTIKKEHVANVVAFVKHSF